VETFENVPGESFNSAFFFFGNGDVCDGCHLRSARGLFVRGVLMVTARTSRPASVLNRTNKEKRVGMSCYLEEVNG
jgi:hypothetical protein